MTFARGESDLLQNLVPKLRVKSIFDIDLDELKRSGIRGIITDLDNTLVGASVPYATPELAEWLRMAHDQGFQVVIVSNNAKGRVSAFAEPLALPYVYRARKPLHAAFVRALRIMSLKAGEAAVIGDQMMTDVLGGNRLGLYTILVEPIDTHSESWVTRNFNRNLERAFTAKLRKKGWLP
jgi:uncharacterized protein